MLHARHVWSFRFVSMFLTTEHPSLLVAMLMLPHMKKLLMPITAQEKTQEKH